MKVDLLGVRVNADTKADILHSLEQRVAAGQKTFITTPYSEFIVRSFRDLAFRDVLNSSDITLPDGIGILWLAYFLSISFKLKKYYLKIIEGLVQIIFSGAQILVMPTRVRSVIPEKISGSDFFWDLCAFAENKQLRIFLLGGYGNTPHIVADKLHRRFHNLNICGIANPNNYTAVTEQIIQEINRAETDLLLMAGGPVKQEKWIAKNLSKLNVKIAIGLGGTFDYVAGKRRQPPKFVRKIGLEWLHRLITQPHRIKRIWQGTFGLILGSLRWKIFNSQPFRNNVAGVIINGNKQILVAKRIPKADEFASHSDGQEHWQFPQGGVDEKEEPRGALLREMKEELGTTKFEIVGEAKRTHTYIWNNTVRRLLFNRLKFKGQTQKIFFLRYHGNGDDLKIDNREFEKFAWVEKKDLERIIHPVRHKMLAIVIEEIDKYL